jgi:hypothetical protein
MAMFNFLGSPQYSGSGLRMNQQSPYEDGIGLRAPTAAMPQGEGLTMASMPQSFGQMPVSQSQMDPTTAIFALKTMQANKPQAQPLFKNNIPMGESLSYEDIMKIYGIKGLMG